MENFLECNKCSGLFSTQKLEIHFPKCHFVNVNELNLIKSNINSSEITDIYMEAEEDINCNKINFTKIIPYTKQEIKDIQKLSDNWLKNGEIDCSICKKIFKISLLEEHEVKCRKIYLEKDNSKFISILLNFTDYPDDWSIGMTENVRVDELSNNNLDYQKIEIRFKKAMTTGKILKIERIQNKNLFDRYTREKNKILAEKGTVKEHFLWHGCRTHPPAFIFNTGFDISFSSDGGAFGRGLYFARLASYSCPAYCYHDATTGVSYVFMAKVITGTYKHLKSGPGLKKPPFWNEQKMIYYDSVTNVDNIQDSDDVNQMYIVYDNDKAYPYYLISYTLK